MKPKSPSFLTSKYRPRVLASPLLVYAKRFGADYVGLRSKRAAQANPSRQCLKNRRTKRSLCQSRSRSQPRLGRELAQRAFISIQWRVHLRDRFGPRMDGVAEGLDSCLTLRDRALTRLLNDLSRDASCHHRTSRSRHSIKHLDSCGAHSTHCRQLSCHKSSPNGRVALPSNTVA